MMKLFIGAALGVLGLAGVTVFAATALDTDIVVSETATDVENKSMRTTAGNDGGTFKLVAKFNLVKSDGEPIGGSNSDVDLEILVTWTDSNADGLMSGDELTEPTFTTTGAGGDLVTESCPSGAAAKNTLATIFNDTNSNLDTIANACFN